MRPFVYLVIFAVAFLIFKAFFLDSYLKEQRGSESNKSVEVTQEKSVPEVLPPTSKAKSVDKSKEEMPLDKLGDELSKHIKL
jgi:hypothetical protein